MSPFTEVLTGLAAVYLMVEGMLSGLTEKTFPLSRALARACVRTFMGAYACTLFEVHHWVQFRETHTAKGLPYGIKKITIYIRQCECCNRREMSYTHPTHKNLFKGWKKCEFASTDTLYFTEQQ